MINQRQSTYPRREPVQTNRATSDLDDFVTCYGSKYGRAKRQETERFRRYGYDELAKRDKLNLDLFWLKDASATDPDTLPPPEEIAAEIGYSLETALEKFRLVASKIAGG